MENINNGQSAALKIMDENQKQVVLSGALGDGCIFKRYNNHNYALSLTSINRDYISYKKSLLGSLCTASITTKSNSKSSYKSESRMYSITTRTNDGITNIHNLSLGEKLEMLNDLGLALWFYDDGSLHKTKMFYNINTQSFSKEENESIIVPYLKNKWGIIGKVTPEYKKYTGKTYYYIRISRYEGSDIISDILNKYYVKDLSYKIWSSETIQRWSKLQEKLKSEGNITNRAKGAYLKRIT